MNSIKWKRKIEKANHRENEKTVSQLFQGGRSDNMLEHKLCRGKTLKIPPWTLKIIREREPRCRTQPLYHCVTHTWLLLVLSTQLILWCGAPLAPWPLAFFQRSKRNSEFYIKLFKKNLGEGFTKTRCKMAPIVTPHECSKTGYLTMMSVYSRLAWPITWYSLKPLRTFGG